MRVSLISILTALGLLIPGCAGRPRTEVPPPAPATYTRIHRPNADEVQLQVASREFRPTRGKGPVIWLVGASHLGEPAYYKALQDHLEQKAVVLFEGVNGGPPESSPQPDGEGELSSSLQSNLAQSLGLVFQLEAMDYKRPHFLNSDLTIDQIQEVLEKGYRPISQNGAGAQQLEELMGMMDGSSVYGAVINAVVRVVGSSPRLQSITKLMMIEMLGSLEGDLSESPALPENMRELFQVLIKARNEKVVSDLKRVLARKPRSVAIFYGAGHMDDLERRLWSELGYRARGEQWFTAFAVDATRAGITRLERNMIRTIVGFQMQALKPPKPETTQ